jgi:hypothetical protein
VERVVAALLPLAVVVAISPVPILAVVLMLLAPRARATGPGFLLGWVAGIAGVTTVVLAVAGPDPGAGGSSRAVAWVELGLGALLLALAVRQWRSRPEPGAPPQLPRWMAAVDRFTAVRAAVLGLVLVVLNPKALPVCVVAGAAIAGGALSGAQATSSVVAFTAIAASTVTVPVLAHLVGRRRMTGRLEALRGWLTVHGAVVTAVLLLVLGVVLVVDGLRGSIS